MFKIKYQNSMKKLFTLLLLSLVFLTASSQECLADNGVKMRKEETGVVKSFKIIPEYDREKEVAYATGQGDVPDGVTFAFETPNRSGNAVRVGTSTSVTISGMPSTCTITGISANVEATQMGGAGRITAKDGDNPFAYLVLFMCFTKIGQK